MEKLFYVAVIILCLCGLIMTIAFLLLIIRDLKERK